MLKLLLFLGLFISYSNSKAEVELQIKKNNPKLSKKCVKNISKAIKVSAPKYGINPKVYAAVLMQESSYRINVIAGQDYGIAQINEFNINAYGLDKQRLLSDIHYSVEAGAKILGWFKKTYKPKDGDLWLCRYNLGTAELIGKRLQKCQDYINKVSRYK